jgi:integrase
VELLEQFTHQAPPVSDDRRSAQLKVLRQLERCVAPAPLLSADGEAVRAFLDGRRVTGASPNTLRKERAMILSFFTWAWRRGHVPAETLVSVRSVAPPPGSTGVARPNPYKRWEMQELWRTLDERWPRLAAEEARRWLRRWQEGRSPYSRVRSHAINLQLDAMIVLALSCCMRRGEIYTCSVDDVHPDNEYIPIARSDGTLREVPHTRMAREAIAAWLEVRAVINPPHDRVWLNLWGRNRLTEPMSEQSFEKVLATYLERGWTFRRLRDTGAVEWLRAGMKIWELSEPLGHRSMKDTLPYYEAVPRDPQREIRKTEQAMRAAAEAVTRRVPTRA